MSYQEIHPILVFIKDSNNYVKVLFLLVYLLEENNFVHGKESSSTFSESFSS